MVENPEKFADKYKIKSSRLLNWDYSTPGYYFITICTYNHNNFFGKIENEKINLSKQGEIAKYELLKTFEIRKNIILGEYIIMPNHIHLIIQIIFKNDTPCRDVARNVSTNIGNVSTVCKSTIKVKSRSIINGHKSLISPKIGSISVIIRSYKSAVTNSCHKHNLWFSWQSRFYDHLINNQKELLIIKNYIINNPQNWQKDKFYIFLE